MFCGKCGHKFSNTDMAFCTQCGTKMPAGDSRMERKIKETMPKVMDKKKLVAGIVASIAIVSVLIFTLILFGDFAEDSSTPPNLAHNVDTTRISGNETNREAGSISNVEVYESEASRQNVESREGPVRVRSIEILLPPIYDQILEFSEGLAAVRTEAGWGFVDTSGNEVITPRFDIDYPLPFPSFSEGLAAVRLNGRWGFIDTAGNEIVPPMYDEAENFSEGLAAVKLNGRWGFIDIYGNEVIPLRYEFATSFAGGQASVVFFEGERGPHRLVGLIDTIGNEIGTICTLRYPAIHFFSEGLAAVGVLDNETGGALWGFVDAAGNEVIPLRFNQVRDFSDGLAVVGTSAGWGLIDTAGNEVVMPRYSVIRAFSEGFAEVLLGDLISGRWGFIDSAGNEVIPPVYDDVRAFSDGLAVVFIGDMWGLIDTSGNEVVPLRYGVLVTFSEGLALVYEGGFSFSFVNTAGDVFPIDLDSGIIVDGRVSNGLVRIQSIVGGRWGFARIDTY